jgi:hypothetical protein
LDEKRNCMYVIGRKDTTAKKNTSVIVILEMYHVEVG